MAILYTHPKVASNVALRDLARQLAPLVSPRQSRQVQEFECVAHCCFCGDALLLSRHHLAGVEPAPGGCGLWAVAVREDHFVRGTDEEGALIVHCQHVLVQLKQLHTKTENLLASIFMGAHRWGADSLLFDERLALEEMACLHPLATF